MEGELDWPLRFRRMQCHSGEHIISGLAHSLYGCTNVGFHLGENEVILDFDKELTAEQLEQLETLANQIVAENRPITAEYPDPEVLKTLDYRSKLDLTENVRIVTVEHCDVCACCAPHVSRTGEIGVIKLLDAMRHRGGIRIWMAAGSMALEDYRVKQKNVAAISAALSVKQPEAAQGVERLLKERDAPGPGPEGGPAGPDPSKAPDPARRRTGTWFYSRTTWTLTACGPWPTGVWRNAPASAPSSPAATRPVTAM